MRGHDEERGLRVAGLVCARGGVPVVQGISFEVPVGGVLVLRGPNGSGKTTLLRTIAGLQPPLAGEVVVAPDAVAYAGHADGIKATLSVAENLEFWASVYGTRGIDAALAAFDIRALAGRKAQNLSAGQKRRLGLARLLVTGRPVWALDEPTVSLDAAATALFADAVGQHVEAGGSAVIATHVDLGIDAETLDMAPFKAAPSGGGVFDEALA